MRFPPSVLAVRAGAAPESDDFAPRSDWIRKEIKAKQREGARETGLAGPPQREWVFHHIAERLVRMLFARKGAFHSFGVELIHDISGPKGFLWNDNMAKLAAFLQRNSAVAGKPLPLVHTCQAYSLDGIMTDSAIKTHFCDVFKEQLNYFFVGRPAYKKEFSDEAAEWELPICFIFSYDVSGAKRVYPFDSGAFARNIFPSFIQMMNRETFEIAGVRDGPARVIGTFFGTPANYFRLKTPDEDVFASKYSLGVFDAEIRALNRLIIKTGKPPDKSTDYKKIDDRRFTIEVQFESDKILKKKDLLAVILPEPYFLDPKVTKFFRSLGAQMISYQTHPLNPNLYYGIIYEKIYDYFRRKKFL